MLISIVSQQNWEEKDLEWLKKKEKKFNNGIPKILNYNTVNGGIMNFIVRLDIDK